MHNNFWKLSLLGYIFEECWLMMLWSFELVYSYGTFSMTLACTIRQLWCLQDLRTCTCITV